MSNNTTSANNEFIIQFSGLKLGHHQFDFDLNESFYSDFESSVIDGLELKAVACLRKTETFLEWEFSIDGKAKVACDRCGDEMEIELNNTMKLVVKFGEEHAELSEELIVIPHEAYEFDIAPYVLECIESSLPLKIEHEDINDCNQEAIDRLEQYSYKEEQVDPRWGNLQDLKNKK